jgi:ribonucleoside-diphosphate reductase alpha chain
MRVVKRNGQLEYFDFKKIEKVIKFASPNEAFVQKFISELHLQLKDGMTTKDLQRTLIQLAAEKISIEEPEWEGVAAKLYLYDLIKEAGINREYKRFGYGSFYKLLKELTHKGLYDKAILDTYTQDEINQLDLYINHERDYLLTYVGIITLSKRYCVKGHAGEVFELPQESFMGVALKAASCEHPSVRLEWVKKFYDILSNLYVTAATPTMSNARKPNGQLSSCFIGMPDDSLESIMNANDLFSQVSKWGGGMGMYIGKIRAEGSDIRGFKASSGGTLPWIKIYNDTAVACNQLGVRQGAISITQDIWHRDIWDFFQLKTNNGDERKKAHDIFPSISIPDLFMKQALSKDRVRDGKWYLFCPHEIRSVKGWSLEDFWGEEFETRYWECVDDDRIPKEEVNPMDLLKEIARSDAETGTPFIFYRDTVNRLNPNKHKGMIYSSNLCHEICQNMSVQGEVTKHQVILPSGAIAISEVREVGDFVVCNLLSINLGRVHTQELIAEIMPIAVRFLDNVITVNTLPVQQAVVTNARYRSIGIGTFGYHHMLAKLGVMWESEGHLETADRVFEWISYYGIKASADLAREKGPYEYFEGSDWHNGSFFDLREYNNNNSLLDWDGLKPHVAGGMRNGYMFAPAPNGSSSQYGGSTQSIDPIFSLLFLDEKKSQVIPIIAPELNEQTISYYRKPAHAIDQKWSIRAAAKRQRHIDQSQSFNLYIQPEIITATDLITYYALIWKSGVKTKYYTRSKSLEIEDCASCSA